MTIEQGVREVENPLACPAYSTDSVTEGTIGGERIQNGDSRFERFRDFVVTFSGLREGLCLLLEDIRDGLEGIALVEFLGKWVFCPWFARLICVFLQRGLEEGRKAR